MDNVIATGLAGPVARGPHTAEQRAALDAAFVGPCDIIVRAEAPAIDQLGRLVVSG
jgi:hypothetical protein